MRRSSAIFLAILLSLLLAVTAHGEDAKYLFQIDTAQTAAVEQILAGADALSEEAGAYATSDPQVLTQLETAGALESYCENGVVSLAAWDEGLDYYEGRDVAALTGMAYAKNRNLTGKGVRIGLVDSGLMAGYSDYTSATVETGENFLVAETDDDRYNAADTYGHGTFVASVIADDTFGIANGVTLVPLRCFGGEKSTWEAVLEAFYAAIDDYHCDVINMSLGAEDNFTALKLAIDYAENKGVVVVAAAGNVARSTGNDMIYYPAGYSSVISVAMTDLEKGSVTSSRHNNSVDIAAPGYRIQGRSYANGASRTGSGTSYAAPVVTASIALALELDPSLTPARIMTLLRETSQDLGEVGYDKTYGYGFLNAGLFLAAVAKDNASAIVAKCGGTYTYSAYRGDENLWLAYLRTYDAQGKTLTTEALSLTGKSVLLNNLPLSESGITYKFIAITDGCIPISVGSPFRYKP